MTKKTGSTEKPHHIVLVGTYRGDQLKDWPGWYCWPLDGDVSAATNTKANSRGGAKARSVRDDLLTTNAACDSDNASRDSISHKRSEHRGAMALEMCEQSRLLKNISELWLYRGTADERRYRAEFIGVKTREELIRDYGYPGGDDSATKNTKDAKREGRALSRPSKPHATHYALFKTELLYRHKNDLPGEADAVIVRLKDFARTPKVRKQLREYLESPDRDDPDLAKLLPSIVTSVPPERLHVCEAAVQLDFMELLGIRANPLLLKTEAKRSGKLTCLDFFAGSGLVSAAMARQFETVWANDISAKKAVVFNANIGTNVLDVRPIEEVDGTSLPTVDLSWGSFPCQDLSLAGDMNGLYASRSGLFWQWLRVMDEMPERPPVVVAENVVGLVSADGGKYYVAVHGELSKRGYNVGAVMLDAVHWVPQSRKRIFVIAVRKGVDISAFAMSGPGWCHPAPVRNVAGKVKNWIWWRLPKPSARPIDITDIIEFDAPCDAIEERDAKLSLVSKERLNFMTSTSKSVRRVFTGYRRTRNHHQVLEVRTDGIAGCLRTPGGGSSRQVVFIVEDGKVQTRLLTVRETARLMGAPDSFKIPGSYNDGYMAMGDGVAFPVAKYLSERLLAPMARLAQ